MIVAQGKAAEAAALGKTPHHTNLFFSFRFGARLARQTGRKKGNHFASVTQGGASLALGYYRIVLTGLQFGSLRSPFRRTLRTTDSAPLALSSQAGAYRRVRCDRFVKQWSHQRPKLDSCTLDIARTLELAE